MKACVHIIRLLIPVLVVGLMSSAVLVLAQQDRPPVDELAPLKDAIQLAGVSPLTPAQESSILALIETFKNTHTPSPSTAAQDARTIYENAILYGDTATAENQGEIIWKNREAEIIQHEKDAAIFAINVISILRTNLGQVEGMILRIGGSRLVKVAISLVERPGDAGFEPPIFYPGLRGSGPGPRGFGFGPRGFGPGPRGPLPPDLNQ